MHLFSQEGFGALHNPMAARKHSVEAVSWMIPQRQAHLVAFAVVALGGRLIEGVILSRQLSQGSYFLGFKELANDDVAVALEHSAFLGKGPRE